MPVTLALQGGGNRGQQTGTQRDCLTAQGGGVLVNAANERALVTKLNQIAAHDGIRL